MSRIARVISGHASRLRAGQTNAERKFWYGVRDRRLGVAKFRRQATIGPYVVDFLCIEAALVVELDGDQHFIGDGPQRDATRTDYLEARGYKVIRFGNQEFLTNIEGTLATVLAAARLQHPHPLALGRESPLPQAGEGKACAVHPLSRVRERATQPTG